MTPDLVNGLFEIGGAVSLLFNVHAVLRDRRIAGVHWAPVVFFTSWGLWNLFYYPHLGQWLSFYGGVAVVVVNGAWLTIVATLAMLGQLNKAGAEIAP